MNADFAGFVPIAAGTTLIVLNKRISGSFVTLARITYGKWSYRGIPLRKVYRVMLVLVGAAWILIGLDALYFPK